MVDSKFLLEIAVLLGSFFVGFRSMSSAITALSKELRETTELRMKTGEELLAEKGARQQLQLELTIAGSKIETLNEKVRGLDEINLRMQKLETENTRMRDDGARREQMLQLLSAQKQVSDEKVRELERQVKPLTEKSTGEIKIES